MRQAFHNDISFYCREVDTRGREFHIYTCDDYNTLRVVRVPGSPSSFSSGQPIFGAVWLPWEGRPYLICDWFSHVYSRTMET